MRKIFILLLLLIPVSTNALTIEFLDVPTFACGEVEAIGCYWTKTEEIQVATKERSPFEIMLTLFHEIFHYLVRNEPTENYQFLAPKLSGLELEEAVADIFAIYILFPDAFPESTRDYFQGLLEGD